MKTHTPNILISIFALLTIFLAANPVQAEYTASIVVGIASIKAVSHPYSVKTWYTVPLSSASYSVEGGIASGGRAESIPEPGTVFLYNSITGLFVWSRKYKHQKAQLR